MVTGIGISYPVSYPGRDDDGHAHPLLGRRLPAFTAADGTAGVAHLASGHAVLFDATDDGAPSECAAGWGERVDVVRTGPVEELDAVAVLVRPDGHVVFADRSGADVEGLKLALKTWFGEPDPS